MFLTETRKDAGVHYEKLRGFKNSTLYVGKLR